MSVAEREGHPVVGPGELFGLSGRVAIVTGAASGLGARFASVLHRAGAQVVLAARRRERLESLAGALGEGAQAVPCDVTDVGACEALVDAALERTGRVDILVNCAGTSLPARAEEQDVADFRASLDVNLTGTFTMCQSVGRRMIEQGSGAIVNLSSMLGLVASTPIRDAGYAASKAGVINLTRELGAQWARKGVRVNALAPGWFPSEMSAEMFTDERSLDWIRRNTMLARAGEPHELDGAILFLASDASSYMTGHTLVVDGGWTAR